MAARRSPVATLCLICCPLAAAFSPCNGRPLLAPSQPRAGSLTRVLQMAGFGSGAQGKAKKGAKDKTASLTMRRQWDRFKELSKAAAPKTAVYARIKDDDAWVLVGTVCAAASVEAAAAVQLQKRLILEHATRVSTKLALKASSLECGLGPVGDPAAVALLDARGLDAPAASAAGFEGEPDPSSRYKGTSNQADSAARDMGLQGAGVKY